VYIGLLFLLLHSTAKTPTANSGDNTTESYRSCDLHSQDHVTYFPEKAGAGVIGPFCATWSVAGQVMMA
jgi:hypothetical protein